MKQKAFLLLAVVLVVAVLFALNAATYVQQEQLPDTEAQPNRSTFNAGATGTRALYELLQESGRAVKRWQMPIGRDFEVFDSREFGTFVVVGPVRRPFEEEELANLLDWVSAGGQLVVIDREPNPDFLVTTSAWEISINDGKNGLSGSEKDLLLLSVDPANQSQMTARTGAVRPSQPTAFNQQINGVQPSKFATSVRLGRVNIQDEATERVAGVNDAAPSDTEGDLTGPGNEEPEPGFETAPPGEAEEPLSIEPAADPDDDFDLPDVSQLAPVIHLANSDRNLLADYPFGAGRIVLLTDPFVVANGGIDLVDNAQLAINVLGSRPGPIAFDEYHQGFGLDDNRLLAYFSGTPVISIFLQSAALIALVLYSRGRRFARPVPAKGKDRLSKLEYVSAMAQLQSRTKAFDLAIENVYTDFRRRASRFFGVDNYTVSRETLAGLIGKRLGTDPSEIGGMMERCEDIMHGDSASRKEVLRLARKIREIEEELGLGRGRVRR